MRTNPGSKPAVSVLTFIQRPGALLLCQRIEDYVTADTPFRVIDTFVQARREEARIWPVGADDDGAATLRKRLNLTVLS